MTFPQSPSLRDADKFDGRELFSRLDFPWASYSTEGQRAVEVDVAARFARGVGAGCGDVEQQMENWVVSVGGKRLQMVDPWNWAARKLRLTRTKSGDVFEIPESAFARRP